MLFGFIGVLELSSKPSVYIVVLPLFVDVGWISLGLIYFNALKWWVECFLGGARSLDFLKGSIDRTIKSLSVAILYTTAQLPSYPGK